MKRRRFLTISVTALGGTLVYHLDRSVFRSSCSIRRGSSEREDSSAAAIF